MKKTIITISGILAALVISLFGSFDFQVPITEHQLQDIFVDVGNVLVEKSDTSTNNYDLDIDDVPWAFGDFETSEKNLIHHFEKHGDNVDVESPQEYYDLANDIIDDKNSIIIEDFYYENSTDYLQQETRFLVGLNPGGSINTLYLVESDRKMKRIIDYVSG